MPIPTLTTDPLADETAASLRNADGDVDAPDGESLTDHEREALELVRRCKREAHRYRTMTVDGSMSLEDEWRDSGNRYMGNFGISAKSSRGLDDGYRVAGIATGGGGAGYKIHRARLMRTQNAIISSTAAMVQRDPHPQVLPVETGFTDAWFLTKAGGRKVHRVMQAMLREIDLDREANRALPEQIDEDFQSHRMRRAEGLALDGTPLVPLAVDMQLEQARRRAVQASEREAAQRREQVLESFGHLTPAQLGFDDAGQPLEHGPVEPLEIDAYEALQQHPRLQGLLLDRDVEPINDTTLAHAFQKVMTHLWDRSDAALHLAMAELYCNIFGQQDVGFQWVEHEHRFELECKHQLNVFTDHSHYDLKRREYHGEDYVISLERAQMLWPKHAQVLKAAADRGLAGSDEYSRGGIYDHVDHERPHVVVTVSWHRHQTVPKSADEALRDGDVVEVGEGAARGYQLVDEKGNPHGEIFLNPPHAIEHGTDWPTTTGLRQIAIIDALNVVIEDIRCPYRDIPHAWDINLPRPDFSGFGQGEPVRTRDLDEQINRALSVIANYMAFYQFPTYFWPAGVLSEVRRQGFDLHALPGAQLALPDDEYYKIIQAGGFEKTRHDAAPMPPIFMQYLQFLLGEHDTSSGNVEVKQGRAPSAQASGRLIEHLSEQASMVMSLRSLFSEIAWTRLAELAADAAVKWLPESEWSEILNRYELPVVREIMRRCRPTAWNLKIEIATGHGQMKDRDREWAMVKWREGLQGQRDTLVALGDDEPDATIRRQQEETAPDQQAPVSPS